MQARIEFFDMPIDARIGTFSREAPDPYRHLLDLVLTIDPELVLVAEDSMADVFDYDPLLARIHDLVQSQHVETQEILLTRMLHLCAEYQAIESVDIRLKKYRWAEAAAPSRPTIGVRLFLTKDQLARLN